MFCCRKYFLSGVFWIFIFLFYVLQFHYNMCTSSFNLVFPLYKLLYEYYEIISLASVKNYQLLPFQILHFFQVFTFQNPHCRHDGCSPSICLIYLTSFYTYHIFISLWCLLDNFLQCCLPGHEISLQLCLIWCYKIYYRDFNFKVYIFTPNISICFFFTSAFFDHGIL